MSYDGDRKLLLEKAQRARRLARSIDSRDPAAKKLFELAAEYEAQVERIDAMKPPPPPPAPPTPTHVAQQQQQPQQDDTDKKE
jgi:hypothetical protein